MKLHFPTVSIHDDTATIRDAVSPSAGGVPHPAGGAGILLVSDLPPPDFDQLQAMFHHLAHTEEGQALAQDLNRAYTKNLVYKDSFASGNGGPQVDLKRVLDLSPERLQVIYQAHPEIANGKAQDLQETLEYWNELSTKYAPKLLDAVAQAIVGTVHEEQNHKAAITSDAAWNFRMVDYFPRNNNHNSEGGDLVEPPRCSEHRDFGTFTLISTTGPGLQVQYQGDWHDVPYEKNTSVLLFGWCTQIRSNGRIPAALHRVVDSADDDERRTSMVLFCAPKHPETPLEPIVLPHEQPRYISDIHVGQLRGNMARKWKHREGTLSEHDKILEEEEIRTTLLQTQDDVVRQHHARTATAV